LDPKSLNTAAALRFVPARPPTATRKKKFSPYFFIAFLGVSWHKGINNTEINGLGLLLIEIFFEYERSNTHVRAWGAFFLFLWRTLWQCLNSELPGGGLAWP
jgi:hypothetical protein